MQNQNEMKTTMIKINSSEQLTEMVEEALQKKNRSRGRGGFSLYILSLSPHTISPLSFRDSEHPS